MKTSTDAGGSCKIPGQVQFKAKSITVGSEQAGVRFKPPQDAGSSGKIPGLDKGTPKSISDGTEQAGNDDKPSNDTGGPSINPGQAFNKKQPNHYLTMPNKT